MYKIYKRIVPAALIILFFVIILSCNRSSVISNNSEPSKPSPQEDYVKDEVIVKFKKGVTEARIKEINEFLGCEIVRSIDRTETYLMKIKTGVEVKEIINKYKLFDEVEYAEPNYIRRLKPIK